MRELNLFGRWTTEEWYSCHLKCVQGGEGGEAEHGKGFQLGSLLTMREAVGLLTKMQGRRM